MQSNDPLDEPGRGGVDPLVGKVLSGRYELEALIARGGMGKIYKATQRPLGRAVALKVLDLHDDDHQFRDRFFLEASLCARLSHPNTVRIFDYGTTDDGIFYIAMEFLEGETLQKMLARDAPLEPLRAIRIVRQICGALAEAHDCGIVHRDLKPGNVILTPHGEDREFTKVLDFGLVKELGKESELSRSGTVLGSPLYISPEQVHGDPVDGRADIYTTGLILYYMLTGQTAFRKGNTLSLLMQQTKAKPPPFAETNPKGKVPAALEWVVMRCLEKRPDDRFASMGELVRALKACEKELRGELGYTLELRLDHGTLVLPDGMEVSTEVRVPVEPPPPVGAAPVPDPTLVTTTSRSAAPLGILAVLGVGGIIAGLVILSLVVVSVVFGLSLWGAEDPPPPPPDPVPIERPAPEPMAPARAEVRLTSTPAGAEVERDGALIGATPLTVSIPEGEEWRVTLRAPDHEPRDVVLRAGVPTLDVPLKKSKKTVRPTPRPDPKPDPAPVAPGPDPVAPTPTPAPRPGSDIRDPWATDPK